MKLKFLGATGTVTGSKYLIENYDQKVLVDCGVFQGLKELRLRNWEPFPAPVEEIDAVVLTHAHIDHTGYLPVLVRSGFKGPIYATKATKDLCEILLRDSGRIQEEDARRANKYGYSKHKPALPLYTENEAIASLKQFKTIEFGQDYHLGDELVFHASRSGHILGSAFLTFRTDERKLVFTGDLGRPYDPIMKKPATIQLADFLVLESTYGDRQHPKKSARDEIGEIINKALKRGGSVLIPSFAVGRAQRMLHIIYQLKKSGMIPDIPVFLDSPMAQDATDIMRKNASEHRLAPDECAKVCHAAKYVETVEDSKAIHASHDSKIIIAASGMVEGGRVLHHMKLMAPNHKNTIIFVGFQAAMTRGDRIIKGAKQVKIHGEYYPVRAHVELVDSLSSHADFEEILEWLEGFTQPPAKVFLTHGEPDSAKSLKEKIEKRFGWTVVIPDYLDEFEL